jgi:thiamine pyrophosphokinase
MKKKTRSVCTEKGGKEDHGKYIANLRYPAKNDKFFAGDSRYSHWYQKTS